MKYEIRFFAGAEDVEMLINLLDAAKFSIETRDTTCGILESPDDKRVVGWWTRTMSPNAKRSDAPEAHE